MQVLYGAIINMSTAIMATYLKLLNKVNIYLYPSLLFFTSFKVSPGIAPEEILVSCT